MRVDAVLLGAFLIAATAYAADARVEQGKKFFDDGDLKRAARVLRPLVDDARLSEDERADARLFLAATLFGLGDLENARPQMDLLARTRPALKPDPKRFPPDFRTAYEEKHAQVNPPAPERAQPAPSPARPGPARNGQGLPKLAILDVRQVGLNDRLSEAASAVLAGEVRRIRAGKSEVITPRTSR